MLLRNLFEAANNEVAIIFGRFNPPHKGHRAAWELASRSPVWFVGTNRDTVGPKDPLPFDVKVEAMKTIWPEVEGHIMAETSWLTMASEIYKKYPKATLLCLTDEDWVTKTIVQYNGKEGAHGFYNFKNITQKPTPRLSSATALRDAVAKDDRAAFSQAAGVDADTKIAGTTFFDLVAKYLLPYANVPKKVPAKKKKEPAATEGKKPEHNLGVGWMLDKDKKLGQKVAQNKARARQERQTMLKYAGKKDLGKEQGVAEVSKSTLDRYVTKAVDDHGHADFAARQSKDDPSKRSYHVDQKKTAEKRRQGISRALDRMSKEGVAEGDRPGMKDGRPYSDPLRRHPGNDSYMTPEYLIQKYQDELKKIAAGPYKRPKDVAMYKARIAKLQRQQGVAEGAPIVVAQAPIDVRNPKKAPQPYRNQGDIVPPTKPPSTEKRGVKGRPGQRPMPKYDEGTSNAMADTAKRLSNKDDGKVAKLRAAGDKRREDQLKGRNIAKRNESVDLKTSLQELSNDMLGKYKKAASADATKADKEGNVKRGDKRFSGIVKATNKQFANDAKKTK
jgi:hypothetical protein